MTSPGALVCHSKSIGLSPDRLSILDGMVVGQDKVVKEKVVEGENAEVKIFGVCLAEVNKPAWTKSTATGGFILCFGSW